MRYLGGGVGHLRGAGQPTTHRPREEPATATQDGRVVRNDEGNSGSESGAGSDESDSNSSSEGDSDGYESLS
jgi:hypothetical protein